MLDFSSEDCYVNMLVPLHLSNYDIRSKARPRFENLCFCIVQMVCMCKVLISNVANRSSFNVIESGKISNPI